MTSRIREETATALSARPKPETATTMTTSQVRSGIANGRVRARRRPADVDSADDFSAKSVSAAWRVLRFVINLVGVPG